MKLVFIRPYAHWDVGQVIDPPAGQAELMIERGICKRYEEPARDDEKHTKRNRQKQ